MESENEDPIAAMNKIPVYGPNQRVRWTEFGDGWAGAGLGKVVDFASSRPFFGAPKGTGRDTPGPAYEIELDGERRHRVWVGPGEIQAAG